MCKVTSWTAIKLMLFLGNVDVVLFIPFILSPVEQFLCQKCILSPTVVDNVVDWVGLLLVY